MSFDFQPRPGAEPYPGYKLVKVLGKGGMGEVWRARRPTGGDCALKFLACDHDTAAAQEIRALQSIRQVKHPNLLDVQNVWSCKGHVVILMELMDGSLLDLLDVYLGELGQAMAPDHVCAFLTQAADAIDFLNTRQHLLNGQRVAFRHCDIKPSNLLVIGPTVKLADFSLAVPTTASTWYHRRNGTPLYCPPEVFQGWLSETSDQYALAASYYHLRTGKPPFPDSPDNISKTYVRPVAELDGVSPAEREVLTRALATTPQSRWPSCAEMMRHLSACCPAVA